MRILYVKDGEIGYLDDIGIGFCTSTTERDEKFANEPPCFLAISYGLGTMWQKKPDGTWEELE